MITFSVGSILAELLLLVSASYNLIKRVAPFFFSIHTFYVQIHLDPTGGTLTSELEDALLKQQLSRMSCSALIETKESRFNGLIQHRLAELEGY